MILSVSTHKILEDVDIYLDDVRQDSCILADDENGIIYRYKEFLETLETWQKDDKERLCPPIEIVVGNVVIDLKGWKMQ